MTDPFRTSGRPAHSDSSGPTHFLVEERESFTQAFAYDHFQWPAFKVFGMARPTVMEFRTPAQRAAEERGLEGQDLDGQGLDGQDWDGGGSAAPYSTTNSAIPVYQTGVVVPVDPDAAITPQTNASGPVVGIDDFRADDRFDHIDGSGYAVVIIDSGIDLDDPFFGPDANGNGVADRIVYQYDFADNDSNASDADGHGSNVASIAASSDATYTGMAPGADIIALKVFSDSGSGHFGYVEQSLQWVINNAAAYNIVSVNMSLGDSGNYNTAISLYGIGDELATLASMGVIVVSASGNDFYELNSVQGVAYPSADPNSLSVGAVYDGNTGGWQYLQPDGSIGAIAYGTGADHITPFSQRDDQLTDVMAPGADIIGAGAGSDLVSMHGTSQAAPHITGIVALAQQLAVEVLGRKLTYQEFSDLLSASADIIFDGDDENDNVANTGLAFPRVNVAKLGEAILDMAEPNGFSIAALSAAKAEGNAGSTAFTFTVTRSGYAGEAASVGYSVSGGSASATDFAGNLLPSGTIAFAAGETSKTLTILVKGDTLFEANESFTVSLSSPSGGGTIDIGSAGGVILNDDPAPQPPSYSIAALNAVRAEGDSGSTAFTFSVTRSGDTSAAGTVNYSVGGAADGADFIDGVLPLGTIAFAAGEASKTLTLHVTGDALVEADEAFTVTLSDPSGDGTIGTGSAGGVIVNDDVAPPSSFLAIAALDAVKLEGDSGTTAFTFTVTRSGSTGETVTVNYGVSGGAVNGADFAGGSLPSGTLTFAAGETSKTVTLLAQGDGTPESDETFTVSLSNPSSNASITDAVASGIIANDDAAGGGGSSVVLLQADFDATNDTEGFDYRDGLFGGTPFQRYASGDWEDQALRVLLGGINNTIGRDMSGGWETDFVVGEAGAVELSFLYRLSIGADYESAEYAQLLVSVDGGTPILVDQLTGDGNDGPVQTTGFQAVTLALGALSAGSHTVRIGAYNNQKTWVNEQTELLIDNVVVTGPGESVPPPPSSFSIAADSAAKAEGDAGETLFTFIVTRGGDTSLAATVDYAVSGSADGDDFAGGTLPAGTLTFLTGETVKVLTIAVAGDTALEGDEGFTVTLSNPSAGSEITTASAAGTIVNDDTAGPATFLAIAAADAVKAEGDDGSTPFTFMVTRSGDTSAAGAVDYAVTGAAEGSDFAGGLLPSGTVSFAAGETSQTLTVNVAGDAAFEGDEVFTVTLSNPSAGSDITTASAQGTIINDDAANPGSFSIAARYTSRAEGDEGESTPFAFEITRTSDTAEAGSVFFEVTSSQADGSDFSNGVLHSGWINFPAGENFNVATLGIWVAGDNIPEADETFTVTLSNPSTGFEITTAAASATILNDDGAQAASFAIAAEDAVKAEGDAGVTAYTFTVTRSGDTSAAGSVDYAVTGAADAGDFVGGLPGGTVSFAAGETSNAIIIQVSGDTDFEADEDFTVTLSNPSAGASITTASAQGTIENDDFPAQGFVLFYADFNGTSSGTEDFTYVRGVFGGPTDPALTRGNWTSADITVVLGGGGSTQGTMTGGWERSFVLDQELELSLSFLYDVFHSRHFEADEHTQVLVSIDGGAPILIDQIAGSAGSTADYIVGPTTAQLDLGVFGPGSHSIVIGGLLNKMDGPEEYNTIGIDDVLLVGTVPTGPATSFAVAADDAVKAEGDSGTAAFTFTVTRSGDTSGAGTVDYAVTGAADGSDFAGGLLPSGTVSFAAGEVSKTLTVNITGDTVFEADEGFTVTLSNPSAGAEIATASAQGTILNDDPAPPATFYEIAALDAVKAEGDGGVTLFTFTISRSGDLSLPASIGYSLAGAGADPAEAGDFEGGLFVLNTATFAAGQSSIAINIRVAGDTNFEADEGFVVTIFDPTNNGAVIAGNESATGTILNDDAAPPATFFAIAAEDAVKAEGDAGTTAFTFTVTRSGDTSAAGTVDYAVTGAADAADFVGGLPSGTLSFAAGEVSKTITVDVAGDTAFEADEGFTVSLSNASAGSEITTASAQGTIVNDDPAPPATFLAIAAADAVKAESDFGAPAFTFTVTRSGDTSAAGSVDYVVSGEVDASDFLGGLPAGTMSFAAGEASKTLTLIVSGDTTLEGDEDFTVTLSNASAGSDISVASANGTILNDDPDSVFAVSAVDAVKAEGNSGTTPFTFIVTRSGDTSEAGSVDYTVANLPAPIFSYPVDGDDFAGGGLPSGTVNFAAGETSKMITINVAGDHSLENPESFMVALSNASPGSEITTSSATGVIENDDLGGPIADFTISADIAVQAEGDAGSKGFTFTVTRSGDTSEPGSVDWAVSGSEVDGADFVGGSLPGAAVIFAAGETSKTFTIEVAGDTDFEADEGFTVSLSNASAGSAITGASADGTILNDDAAPPATFLAIAADDAVKEEGLINGTFLTFTVTRSGDTAVAGTVDYAVSGAVDGADFVGGLLPSGTLSFVAGEVTKTLSFNVAGDGDEEPDEAFTITLSNASAGSAITTASAQGIILNDDGPPEPPVESYLSIEAVDAVKGEGDDGTTLFTFIVSRPGTIIGDASVDYTVTGSGDNPAEASDFAGGVLPSGTVTIQGEGASSVAIVIEVAADSGIEPDETFTVTLSNPSPGAAIVAASAEGVILNDDSGSDPGDSVVILAADFDSGTEGFVYSDGVFVPLPFQTYASGSWEDQALALDLGGVNNRIGRDMAGAWETDFVLTEEMEVTLGFAYEMLISADYDAGEYSQLLVSIDGGTPILVEELLAGGTLSASDTVELQLGSLAAGSHSLAIGGYNNQKSWSNEFTEISIDDVLVTGTPAAGGATALAGGGFALGSGVQPLAALADQESELLATV